MSSADLVVDLDLAVRRGRTVERRRARHALRGRSVHVLESTQGDVRSRWVDVRAWPAELADACRVSAPDDRAIPPDDGALLPWDLVVGTGAALSADRPDLYAELVAPADDRARDQLGRLHRATLGRLRAVGLAPGRQRIGWVSWVLVPDGWRSLTPCLADRRERPRPMVRLERRSPDDLVHEVARWAASR
jgi:hypothetical protein